MTWKRLRRGFSIWRLLLGLTLDGGSFSQFWESCLLRGEPHFFSFFQRWNRFSNLLRDRIGAGNRAVSIPAGILAANLVILNVRWVLLGKRIVQILSVSRVILLQTWPSRSRVLVIQRQVWVPYFHIFPDIDLETTTSHDFAVKFNVWDCVWRDRW